LLFHSLLSHAEKLDSEYARGYRRGLRRKYHGDKFGTAEQHAMCLQIQSNDNQRKEHGRGYQDGFAGKEPAPA
jgi:ribosome modulation factor